MKTFIKIALVLAVGLVAIKLFPILLVPAMLSVVVMLIIGALMMGGLAAFIATGLVVVVGLLTVVLGVAAILSPLWLPVLAVIGLISLCRRPKATA